MTKDQAYQEMLKGFKMKHEYYSDDEYVFINSDGKFETEDGCVHGGVHDEFWSVYQKWNDGWDYYSNDNGILDFNSPYNKEVEQIYELTSYRDSDRLFYGKPSKSQLLDADRLEGVKPKSLINRNDLCSCGSGLKYKKCCLK